MDFDEREWTQVERGKSGAVVFRRGDRYAKRGRGLDGEAARLRWLAGRIRVPELLFADTHLVVTAALPGVPCDELPPARRLAVMQEAVQKWQALPTGECPFVRRVPALLAEASWRWHDGLVDEEDFDEIRRGRSVESLLAELRDTASATEELVVCHGDLCPENVIVDGDTIGFVDVGRAAVADRHVDLAPIAREFPDAALGDVDPARLAWYQLLDEFF